MWRVYFRAISSVDVVKVVVGGAPTRPRLQLPPRPSPPRPPHLSVLPPALPRPLDRQLRMGRLSTQAWRLEALGPASLKRLRVRPSAGVTISATARTTQLLYSLWLLLRGASSLVWRWEFDFTCGLTHDGTAYCWGSNNFGQLGINTTNSSRVPVPVIGGLTFSSLAAGSQHTCGLVVPSGVAYCWGRNNHGFVGDGTTTTRLAPVPVSGGRVFSSISAAVHHTCGITPGGAAYCWGYNQ